VGFTKIWATQGGANCQPHSYKACGQGLYQNKGPHEVELTAGQILEKCVAKGFTVYKTLFSYLPKLTSIAQAQISIDVDLQGSRNCAKFPTIFGEHCQ
jgi:hypothetical protein